MAKGDLVGSSHRGGAQAGSVSSFTTSSASTRSFRWRWVSSLSASAYWALGNPGRREATRSATAAGCAKTAISPSSTSVGDSKREHCGGQPRETTGQISTAAADEPHAGGSL
jgi:hypothetical protein